MAQVHVGTEMSCEKLGAAARNPEVSRANYEPTSASDGLFAFSQTVKELIDALGGEGAVGQWLCCEVDANRLTAKDAVAFLPRPEQEFALGDLMQIYDQFGMSDMLDFVRHVVQQALLRRQIETEVDTYRGL